jgi:hypothetical protein
MMSQSRAPGVVTLNHKECWELLTSVTVGRLAVLIGKQPEIFPINYAVDGGTLVFRSAAGSKLDAALAGPVGVEADGLDAETRTAWSVMIRAEAMMIDSEDGLLAPVILRLFPWHSGPNDHFVRIIPNDVSGRLFTVEEQAAWWYPLDGAGPARPE